MKGEVFRATRGAPSGKLMVARSFTHLTWWWLLNDVLWHETTANFWDNSLEILFSRGPKWAHDVFLSPRPDVCHSTRFFFAFCPLPFYSLFLFLLPPACQFCLGNFLFLCVLSVHELWNLWASLRNSDGRFGVAQSELTQWFEALWEFSRHLRIGVFPNARNF